jgi:hypothetical protein
MQNASAGFSMNGEMNKTIQSQTKVCVAMKKDHCEAKGGFLCTPKRSANMESSRCVRNCLECYGKEAGEDGECKAPKEIKSNNKFFCDRKGTTVDNCNDCKDPSDGDIEFTIGNATTHRCDINKAKFGNDDAVMKKELQSKGKFHCVIGEVDKYVDDCTMDCHAIDDQFGEIKKTRQCWRQL